MLSWQSLAEPGYCEEPVEGEIVQLTAFKGNSVPFVTSSRGAVVTMTGALSQAE